MFIFFPLKFFRVEVELLNPESITADDDDDDDILDHQDRKCMLWYTAL